MIRQSRWRKNQSELLQHALTKLSAEHRQIIDLVYYHEQSVDEAAQVLGIPAATVKTRMFYARKKLGEWLKAGCRRAFCWNSMWRNLQRHEVIEFKRRGQLADRRWSLWRASASHRPCAMTASSFDQVVHADGHQPFAERNLWNVGPSFSVISLASRPRTSPPCSTSRFRRR